MDNLTAVKIELLENAYKGLEVFRISKIEAGICWVLQKAADKLGNFDHVMQAHVELHLYIERTLGNYGFYHSWLWNEAKKVDPGFSEDAIRRGRLAWIDAMIAALREGRELPATPSLPSDYKPRPSSLSEQNFYRI